MAITLKEVTLQNYWEVLSLSVSKEQEDFIAPNAVSLAEAFVYDKNGDAIFPFAIYDDNKLIGFTMFAYDEKIGISPGNYLLFRLMIDQKFQGQGYFKLAMDAILNWIKSDASRTANYLWISYEPENTHARSCYLTYGFFETGDMLDNEIVAVYQLTN